MPFFKRIDRQKAIQAKDSVRALRPRLPVIILVGFGLLLYAWVLDGGWRWDDPQILLFAYRYDWVEYMFRPEIWQRFTPNNLTPLVILSFELDLAMFGLSPRLFYLHQLAVLIAASYMLYQCLRLWCSKLTALAGGVFFLTGLPVMVVAEQLMTRHYIEGLLLALVSVYGFVKYLRTSNQFWLLLSLLAYGLACLAKEVYVPLPFLLLCIPDGERRQRTLASAPYFVMLLGYTLWRLFMLKSLGGYAESTRYIDPAFLTQVVTTFANIPQVLTGELWPFAVGLWLVLLIAYVMIGKRLPWRGIVIALLVLGPLVPLVPGITAANRYLFVVWAALSFALGYMLDRFINNGHAMFHVLRQGAVVTVFLLLVSIHLVYALPVRHATGGVNKAFDVQGEFLLANTASASFLPTATMLSHFHFITGLRDIKSHLNLGSSAVAIVDDLFLAELETTQLWQWQPDCACMVDISDQVELRQDRFAAHLRAEAPMSVHYSYQDGVFAWALNAEGHGRWDAISNIFGVYPMSASGRLRIKLFEPIPFYIRYTHPDGWLSYSDELHINLDGEEVQWSRGQID